MTRRNWTCDCPRCNSQRQRRENVIIFLGFAIAISIAVLGRCFLLPLDH